MAFGERRKVNETIRSQSGFRQTSTNEELREYFECPVCFEVPRSPPIFACSRVNSTLCSYFYEWH